MNLSQIKLKNLCACGKNHECVTKNITIDSGENLRKKLKNFIINEFGTNSNGCVICDFNTYQIIDSNLKDRCKAAILDIHSHHADEYMIEACDDIIKNKDYDYFIAVGAGTIHDITRVISHKYNKKFISYPSAASVDGFVSVLAPVTSKDGMKNTIYAVAPVALFADIDILANAPKRLTASGVGDILGKYISLADWRMSNLLTGEYICEAIIEIIYNAVNKVRDTLIEYRKNQGFESYRKLCAELLEALVISGVCMQYTGNSRPASAAEHHIAHLFEMNIILSTDCLHGENVGVGSVLCAELYHKFAESEDIKFAGNYSIEHDIIKKYYKDLYGMIIKENTPDILEKITSEIFYDKLENIKKIIADIPSKEELTELLDILGGIKDIDGIKAYDLKCGELEIAPLAFKLAPYIRGRFTLMKFMKCVGNVTV